MVHRKKNPTETRAQDPEPLTPSVLDYRILGTDTSLLGRSFQEKNAWYEASRMGTKMGPAKIAVTDTHEHPKFFNTDGSSTKVPNAEASPVLR